MSLHALLCFTDSCKLDSSHWSVFLTHTDSIVNTVSECKQTAACTLLPRPWHSTLYILLKQLILSKQQAPGHFPASENSATAAEMVRFLSETSPLIIPYLFPLHHH